METLDLHKSAGAQDAVFLDEEHYAEQMKETVEPALARVRESGRLPVQGGELYYELIRRKDALGTVVICHGFSESVRKYDELVYYFYRAGYQTAIWDQRGHGLSLRAGGKNGVVHIERFDDFVEDMRAFIEEKAKPLAGDGKLFLYAHSMGGCVSTLYMERYPEVFEKAVLNAPMLGIQMSGCPVFAAKALCHLMRLFGKKEERLFFQGEFDPQEPFSVSCSDSEARHFYYLEKRKETEAYQTSSASYTWALEAAKAGERAVKVSNASRLKLPILLFQAENDNQVLPGAQERFIARVADGRLLKVPGCRHEIYRAPVSVLRPYLAEIFEFYQK